MGTDLSMSSFIFTVVASIVAWLVCGYILKPLVDWINDSKPNLKTVVRCALGFFVVITGAFPLFYIYSQLLGIDLPEIQFRFAFCAWLLQLVMGYRLYHLMHVALEEQASQAMGAAERYYNELLQIQNWLMTQHSKVMEKQYDDKQLSVRAEHRTGSDQPVEHAISARRLCNEGLRCGERLFLSCRTFVDGLAFLMEQINDYAPMIRPDLYVGINSTAGIMATFFSKNLGRNMPVGFVQVGGHKHEVSGCLLPRIRRPKTIIVTDIEIKRGRSMKNVFRLLRQEYGIGIDIYIAVLVASEVSGPIEHISDLLREHMGVFKEDQQYLPDFLAFTSGNKVRLYGNVI